MDASSYALEVRTPLGDTLITTLQQWESLEWTQQVNGYGYLSVQFGAEQFDPRLFQIDHRLDLWRMDVDGVSRLVGSYWARGLTRTTSETGVQSIVLRGVGRDQLLERRIIAAAAGSAGASKSGAADDVIKAYVREAMGALASADRDWSANGLTIAADLGAGPVVTKSASRRNLLTVLQEISDASAEVGERVYFGLVWQTNTTMQFVTKMGLWGLDRRLTRTPFSLLRGTLTDAVLDYDARDEVTYVYAAGQGQGDDREVVEVQDAARLAATPWGRIEDLADARHGTSTDAVRDAGHARLAEKRPAERFDAVLQDAPGARFGVDWALGDLVQAEYGPELFDCTIMAVQGRAADGEQIAARLEAERA